MKQETLKAPQDACSLEAEATARHAPSSSGGKGEEEDGDMVVVEPREPQDGDIVAALIDGETTLKRYIQKNGEPPYLKAENKFYPELYPINDLTVQGVAKAVVRSI